MSSAISRAYNTDVIVCRLIKHLDKASLRSLMMAEQRGEVFGLCVRELYREIRYDVVENMVVDSDRKNQYLNAVQTIVVRTSPRQTVDAVDERAHFENHLLPLASDSEIARLQSKCPNLAKIVRDRRANERYAFSVTIGVNSHTRTMAVHTVVDRSHYPQGVPRAPPPDLGSLPASENWQVEHTFGLTCTPCQPSDKPIESMITADESYSHFDFPILSSVKLIGEAISRRSPQAVPIDRISGWANDISIDTLRVLFKCAGRELVSLRLITWLGDTELRTIDLPRLVRMIYRYCPKLVDLQLPITAGHHQFQENNKCTGPIQSGVEDIFAELAKENRFTDEAIGLPPAKLRLSGGQLDRLKLDLQYPFVNEFTEPLKVRALEERVCSFNFARNIACLLRPGGDYVHSVAGDVPTSLEHQQDIATAVKYFQQLRPTVEPHFRRSNLARHLSLSRITDVAKVQSLQDGTALPLSPAESVKPAKLYHEILHDIVVDELHRRNVEGDAMSVTRRVRQPPAETVAGPLSPDQYWVELTRRLMFYYPQLSDETVERLMALLSI